MRNELKFLFALVVMAIFVLGSAALLAQTSDAGAPTAIALPAAKKDRGADPIAKGSDSCSDLASISCLKRAQCVDMKIGVWMREYGTDKRKADAWKALCLDLPPVVSRAPREPVIQTPFQ